MHLRAVTTVVAHDGPLIAFADPAHPLVALRRGDGIVGIGEVWRGEFRGASRFADAARTWRELADAAEVADPVHRAGSGLVAFGSFAFADDSGAASVLAVQAGYDARAPLSLDGKPDFVAGLRPDMSGRRIAWLGDLGGKVAMETGILDLCQAALGLMEGAGAVIEPHVPSFDMEALWQAFVTLRHFTSGSALKVLYDNPDKRALMKPEAIFEVEGGLDLLAAPIFAASQVRTAWYRHLLELFGRFDFLALPTAQIFPFPVERHWPEEIAGRRMDSYHRWMELSALATMAGLPAVNVPVGFSADGRPMGMQLIGRPRGDQAVLNLAAGYEEVTPFGVR